MSANILLRLYNERFFFQVMLKLESKFVYIDIFLTECRSTFLKQMKFMHSGGFKTEEKYRLTPIINRQIIDIIRCIY